MDLTDGNGMSALGFLVFNFLACCFDSCCGSTNYAFIFLLDLTYLLATNPAHWMTQEDFGKFKALSWGMWLTGFKIRDYWFFSLMEHRLNSRIYGIMILGRIIRTAYN